MRKIASPRSGIFAGSMTLCFCRVEHGFNASAKARGRFRLLLPYGLQDLENVGSCDLVDRKAVQRGGIGRER